MGERRSFASGPRSPSLYVILYVHAESHMKGVAGASGEAAATNAAGPTEPRAKRARHCSSLTDSGPSSAHRSRAASRRWWAAASESRVSGPACDSVALRAAADADNASNSASAAKRRWTYSSRSREGRQSRPGGTRSDDRIGNHRSTTMRLLLLGRRRPSQGSCRHVERLLLLLLLVLLLLARAVWAIGSEVPFGLSGHPTGSQGVVSACNDQTRDLRAEQGAKGARGGILVGRVVRLLTQRWGGGRKGLAAVHVAGP